MQQLIPIENTLLNNEAWEEWLQHRKEIRKSIKPGSLTEKKQQKMLCEYPHDIQAMIIEQSIQNGWMGLFPEKIAFQMPRQMGKSQHTQDDFIATHTDKSWADGL